MTHPLKGEVTAIAFGGEGIVRDQGLVTFIPYTTPGDLISYEFIEKKKSFARGKLLDIITPSQSRTTPLCPYFGTCGGCQLQQMSYASQLECKRQWIQDAIHRQAKQPDVAIPPIRASQHPWHYRRKIVLTLKPEGDCYIAGYTANDGRSHLKVGQCPIFCDPKDPIIEEVQRLASRLQPSSSAEAKAVIVKVEDGKYLLHLHFKVLPINAEEAIATTIATTKGIRAIKASDPRRTIQHGAIETCFDAEGLKFRFSADAFIQNHPEQSLNIYQELCRIAHPIKPSTILDLYCGIGISTLILKKSASPKKVIGIEANREAVRLAKENAAANNIGGVEFVCDYVEKALPKILRSTSFDLAILNPPREGVAKEALEMLLQNPPESLIYISCMPATLARDVKFLCEDSYKLISIQGYDMSPQTTHVETVAVLNRLDKSRKNPYNSDHET